MAFKKSKKSSGAVSSILLILGIALLIIIIVVFVVLRINAGKANKAKETENQGPPPPVYETNIGDVRFVFVSAQDIGNVLKSKDKRFQEDLTTTEKFIKVVIGAQNKGKVNIKKDTWNIGNIVDSEGRNFVPVLEENRFYTFSNDSDLCGSLLKPDFEPTPCVKYYEVAKISTGLKIEVNITAGTGGFSKKQTSFIDLIVE